MSSDLVLELQQCFAQLEEQLRMFNLAWPNYVLEAQCWEVPMYDVEQPPNYLSLNYSQGDEAIERIRTALTRFDWLPNQAPVQVYRLPGFVHLSQDVIPVLNEINTLKSQIYELMQTIPPGSRARLRKTAFGAGVSILQIYRHIFSEASTPRRLVFSWIGNSFSSEKRTVTQVRERLLESEMHPPTNYSKEEWFNVIDIERKKLNNPPPGGKIMLRKPQAPHPRMLIFRHADYREDNTVSSLADENHHANLPLFIVSSGESMQLNPLEDFERNNDYTPRKKTTIAKPLAEGLNLYWVQPISDP